MRVEIKSGDVFGRLTVLQRNYRVEQDKVAAGKQRRPYYDCVCECGNTKTVEHYSLLRQTKSCGCLQRENSGAKPVALKGQTFGHLRVLDRDIGALSGSGKHAKWICACLLCGSTVSVRGSDLTSGKKVDCGCAHRERCSLASLVNREGDVYGHLTVLRRDMSVGVKSGQHARWICRCELCGREESVAANMFSEFGKDRCRNCLGKSMGEAVIADILTENKVSFVRDRPYLDCINDKTNRGLRFDFRITSDDSECLYFIEYDGLQHYKAAPMWDDIDDLEERQRKDDIKNEWCRKNGIALIRIPYSHYRKICIDDLRLESTRFRVV